LPIWKTIERYRAELGTVVVAGIDGAFKTVPKSPVVSRIFYK